MKKLFLPLTTVSFVLSFFLCIVSVARSGPRWNVPQKLVQPNGFVVHCFASGDEFNHWLHDKDNYTIIQHPATGYFVYALLENDALAPSEYVVGKINPARVGLRKGANISEKEMKIRRETFMKSMSGTLSKTSFADSLNNLVIFIRFADEQKSIFPDSIARFNRLFNSNADGANSMFNYFKEVSYGKASISTTCYPLAVDSLISYQDANPRNYYKRYNNVTNPIGFTTDAIAWTREKLLLTNAAKMVASQIPPELNIDANGDGNVDNICYIASGDVDAWTELLWPHAWVLPVNSAVINGKQVRTFNFQLRDDLLTSPKYDGVASLSHEMFHTIGAPDLYHYTNHGSPDEVWPVWKWDIMGYVGSAPPPHMGAYMKFKYGNWIDSIPTIKALGTFTLSPLAFAINNCYKIPSLYSSTEFYVVEYRKRIKTFESPLPDEGLLVYRINTAITGNSDGPPDEVYMYRSGGFLTLNGSPDSAAYSANSGRELFNDYTNPSCFLTNGSIGGLNISNVGFLGDTITFTLGAPLKNQAWIGRLSGTRQNLHSVSFTDMSKGTTVGDSGTILCTTNGGMTWTKQISGTKNNLHGVSFIDGNIGSVVGDSGNILRTTNSGLTWINQISGTTKSLNGVSFTDANNGTAVGDSGTILRTTNAGVTWTIQSCGMTPWLYGVCFTDSSTGTVVGRYWSDADNGHGILLRTTNGGENWVEQSIPQTINLSAVSFTDASYGTAVGMSFRPIATGGVNRSTQWSEIFIIRTTNGGSTWTQQTPPSDPCPLNAVSFVNANTGTAVGHYGTIIRTTDGGSTWTSQSSGTTNSLYGVSFTDANNGTVAGDFGTILRTTTGGITWIDDKKKNDYEVPNLFSLSQNYPNPFNPTTTIEYQIPKQSFVTLKIFDLLGREVATLVNEQKNAGYYSVQWNASGFSSGVYFYRLEANEKREMKKMILMK